MEIISRHSRAVIFLLLFLAEYTFAMPSFGRDLRSQFLFDANYTSLNHGSYGSIPKDLVPVSQDLRLKAELNPDRWLRRDMFPEIEKNKQSLAQLVNADSQELVFVFNAMTGINTVARSLVFEKGDKVLYVRNIRNIIESTHYFSLIRLIILLKVLQSLSKTLRI